MLGLKLNHVSKRGRWGRRQQDLRQIAEYAMDGAIIL